MNEPCACTGTFNARVRVPRHQQHGHDPLLRDGALLSRQRCRTDGIFDPGDVLIGDIPPKSDAVLRRSTIPNYPCGAGLVCFGACGPGTDRDTGQPDCSFPKGVPCPAGQCCTTISWDVNQSGGCPQPHDKVITSKCRHQQVCIQGRGGATLDCDTSATGVQTNCAGASAAPPRRVRLCTTEAAAFGPFTFTLHGRRCDPDGDRRADRAVDFTVGPITANTTFTGTVTEQRRLRRSRRR